MDDLSKLIQFFVSVGKMMGRNQRMGEDVGSVGTARKSDFKTWLCLQVRGLG
jgi:hypothetical protein